MNERRCDVVSVRVSALLDAARRSRALSIKALADRAELAPHSTGYALDGRTMRTSTLAKLAEALDCDVIVQLRPRPQPVNFQRSAYGAQ